MVRIGTPLVAAWVFIAWAFIMLPACCHAQERAPQERASPPLRDFGDSVGDCPQVPFFVVRYLIHALDRYPRAGAIRVDWFCLAGGGDDHFNCVYVPRRAALTVYYLDVASGDRSVSRLYRVTRPVLTAASREPLLMDGRGLSFNDPFGFLRGYGARQKP